MIEIDGENGGGQMLRTALTLSAITGENFEIINIRGSRSNTGIKNQHLACVKAAGRLCNAKITGGEIGSEKIVFKPEKINNESFSSNIGTAGSITLLFDTILPITTQFSESFRFTAKGGTDVKWSPTINYFKYVKLPLLRNVGLKAKAELYESGYYPEGGGKADLTTEEFSMDVLELDSRGKLEKFEIYSKASKNLQEADVADRQADEAARMLKNDFVSTPVRKSVEYVELKSTGSSILIKAVYENSVVGFDAIGEKGKRSEDISRKAFEDFKSFHKTDAAVDGHMADQLMVFLALAGGKIAIPRITDHIETNLEVIRDFGFDVEINKIEDGYVLEKV